MNTVMVGTMEWLVSNIAIAGKLNIAWMGFVTGWVAMEPMVVRVLWTPTWPA